LQHELDISLLLITHDLAIAAERADSLVVLKGGVLQEAGKTSDIFSSPKSVYAKKLHGDVPALNPDRYAALRDPGFRLLNTTFGKAPKIEVSGVTKTTAIRLLLGLEQPDTGKIAVAGEQLNGRSHDSLRAVWRHLQLVYQNPFTSLDPTWRVEQLVREPLDRFKIGTATERAERVREALADVGLDEHLLLRKPEALSGGQRQRVAIARALVLKPDVIVLDEPTSALDVSVQADIVEVLLSLQAKLGLTYVFVSHDLALVRQLAHTVSVMQCGRIVEHGIVTDIFERPQQPYTRSLLESIPSGIAGDARVSRLEPRRIISREKIA
jgi:peptide/nickel transport system ATP-binding protein